ncbi:receptor-type tyrosine-protein phosphatase S-like isoform X3 [Halichondria panicea]|uniref:receptor-type tyrosine-protein phosphatase S-like isoform X3 n=1 Tax=Halichondria panicea TaxID=6063 RepID=UPI00312B6571
MDPPENVLGYTMAYTTGNSTGFKFFDDYIGDNATLMDVIAGEKYSIRMQAFGDFGIPGRNSRPIAITLRAGPVLSIGVTNRSSTSIDVQWIIVNTTDIITGFQVSYAPRNNKCIGIRSDRQVVVGGQARHHSLTVLQEGVEYNITVQARGEQGYGKHSTLIVGTTLDAVPTAPPMNVTSVLSVSGIVVSWLKTPCEHINSLAGLIGFMVRYRPKGEGWLEPEHINNTAARNVIITTGIIVLVYDFQVAAVNTKGVGPYSSSVTPSVVPTEESSTTESGTTESGTTESGTTESGTTESSTTESSTTESSTTETESSTTETESSTTESSTTETESSTTETESSTTESGTTESGTTESGTTETESSTTETESNTTETESSTTETESSTTESSTTESSTTESILDTGTVAAIGIIIVVIILVVTVGVIAVLYCVCDPSSKIPMEECQAYAVLAQQRSGSGKPDQSNGSEEEEHVYEYMDPL